MAKRLRSNRSRILRDGPTDLDVSLYRRKRDDDSGPELMAGCLVVTEDGDPKRHAFPVTAAMTPQEAQAYARLTRKCRAHALSLEGAVEEDYTPEPEPAP